VSVDEVEVLAQNRAFYAAFRQRDLDSMDELWAQHAKVACVHPGWQPLRGREQVMASWRAILSQSSVPQIRCEEASAHVLGDTAFVLCEELVGDGRLVATNVFVREDGDWRLCHHQAGPMAPGAHDDDDDDELPAAGEGRDGIDLSRFLLRRRDEDGDSEDDAAARFDDAAEDGEDPFTLAGGDALAGSAGPTATASSRGASLGEEEGTAGSSELDDHEAPEAFLNLVRPATRRLLN
jgi:ketosteroid isomerase-like protein